MEALTKMQLVSQSDNSYKLLVRREESVSLPNPTKTSVRNPNNSYYRTFDHDEMYTYYDEPIPLSFNVPLPFPTQIYEEHQESNQE